MLRKIDCVMLRVPDPAEAATYYERVLGLHRLWADDHSVGLGLPETDAEIVLHTDPAIPTGAIYYLVDDVESACAHLTTQGCTIRQPPLPITIGSCAVLEDPFTNPLRLIDLTRGPRQPAA
ncbi:VOC family protein [Streptomyces sp. B6B3]|uniref:VOC family protein n=1 Tax=Streptomyces sp. B6B3 TaxID=3153570 RepID=UPI00325CB627